MSATSPLCSLLSANGLGIIRGDRVLFQGVDLDVSAGEAIHLRGSNGAGKTTLLRILAGLTRPDAGSVKRNAALHWLGHRDGLKPHETPRAHLSLWARAWGIGAGQAEAAMAHMELSCPADVPARLLSAGQRRRTALARLRLEARPLWVLDEPNAALDTGGQALLAQMVGEHLASGGAVIAALHGRAPFEATREVQL